MVFTILLQKYSRTLEYSLTLEIFTNSRNIHLFTPLLNLSDLHKNPWINLMAITPELNATIITGLKGKSKEDYDLYLQKLAEDTKEDMNIPRKQKYYDKTRGNPGMS